MISTKVCAPTCYIVWWFIICSFNMINCDDSLKKTMHNEKISDNHTSPFDKEYWAEQSMRNLKDRLARMKIDTRKVARNVIFFLGDGMGVPIVSASRIYWNQQQRNSQREYGAERGLAFERFPSTALVRTYSLDRHVTDSAASATAYLCGVKANFRTIGVGPEVSRDDCRAALRHPVPSIALDAIRQGKWAGLVTTMRLTHATPAGFYAHSASRYWETDREMVNDNASNFALSNCKDHARQLMDLLKNENFQVALGGGRRAFLPENETGGLRMDGRNLIREFTSASGGRFVDTRNSLKNSVTFEEKTRKLLGIFNESHLPFSMESELNGNNKTPSLAEMTSAAIKKLQYSPNGFFLFVEGGNIDIGLHQNRAKVAIGETIALQDAVLEAVELTKSNETLIIVTADHSHVMDIVGYPRRNISILGYTINPGTKPSEIYQIDNKPLSILSFANGPAGLFHTNSSHTVSRRNFSQLPIESMESVHFQQATFIPYKRETHGGEDVALYATGPASHLFTGVIDNTEIAMLLRYAMCVGISGKNFCETDPLQQEPIHSKGIATAAILLLIIIVILISIIFLVKLKMNISSNKIRAVDASVMTTTSRV